MFHDLQLRTDLLSIMGCVVDKFNQETSAVRLMAQRAMRAIDYQVKSKSVISLLLNYLNDPSWHIREECVNHLIFHFMNHRIRGLDYASVVS